jgi:KaiC/GvpD/RAD55 family RecA-like ATPase
MCLHLIQDEEPDVLTDRKRGSVKEAIQLELRAYLTPRVRQVLQDRGAGRLQEVVTLLRRLRPDDARTAILCHRVVLAVMREDIRDMGWIDFEWADLPRRIYNVLEAMGYDWREGRWVLTDPIP